MIRIPDSPAYCIDQFEGMLVGLDAGGAPFPWSPYVNPGTQRVRAMSVRGVIPQAYMNKYQSAAACAEAGKRLCTYHEWLRACRGSEGWTYPYGNTRDQNIDPAHPPASWDPQGDACDGARWVHSAVEYFAYFGETGSYVWNHLTHPCIDQVPQGLDPTGWRERCASQDGVDDMMGNVHEWIDERDVFQASGGTRSVPAGHGAFAGGYYLDTYLNGPGCSYLTTAHYPDQVDASTGFRCCAAAQ
jgi:formylglycine-generating enzyme required for sulfatase activity